MKKKRETFFFLNKITFNIKLDNARYYVTSISYCIVYYHNNRSKCIDIRQKKRSRKIKLYGKFPMSIAIFQKSRFPFEPRPRFVFLDIASAFK